MTSSTKDRAYLKGFEEALSKFGERQPPKQRVGLEGLELWIPDLAPVRYQIASVSPLQQTMARLASVDESDPWVYVHTNRCLFRREYSGFIKRIVGSSVVMEFKDSAGRIFEQVAPLGEVRSPDAVIEGAAVRLEATILASPQDESDDFDHSGSVEEDMDHALARAFTRKPKLRLVFDEPF